MKRCDPLDGYKWLLDELHTSIHGVLGQNAVGLYVFGSIIYGDFDSNVSDIDLLAVVNRPLDTSGLDRLRGMHDAFATRHQSWRDRIEVAYVPRKALRTFKCERSEIGIISPGEPLHIVSAGSDWLMNWYFAQSHGVTLFGPDPSTLIEPITDTEFISNVRLQAEAWGPRVSRLEDARGASYAALTLGRTLATIQTGKHLSKQAAARWVASHWPEWSTMLEDAFRVRAEPGHDQPDPVSVRQVQAFYALVMSEIDDEQIPG